jgi:glycosyltransferase involved in cell wall biosynthesis
MRLAHIILPGASEYERKSQRIDQAALAAQHDVTVLGLDQIDPARFDLAHVYASGELPASSFARFPLPYVASAGFAPSHWRWRKPVPPRAVLSPLSANALPEAVKDAWFAPRERGVRDVKIVGSFGRRAVRNSVEQSVARIQRFRSDVTWQIYERAPTPDDLAGVDAWVDPAVDPSDFDGFVAEALVLGLPVVATRTPINVLRLEQNRTGWLVPVNDPNEMTHAILAALFKTEVVQTRQLAARQTVSKFRARHRIRVLTPLYETLIR